MTNKDWLIFKNECKKNNIKFYSYGGTFNKNSTENKSIKENMYLIQESLIAPDIRNKHHTIHNYIPCRTFKNISYGKMGITNSNSVNILFDNKLIYSSNISDLVKKSLDFEKEEKNKDKIIKELMENVRDNHTYINRINFIIDFLQKFKNITILK
jgi:hypothetical protein